MQAFLGDLVFHPSPSLWGGMNNELPLKRLRGRLPLVCFIYEINSTCVKGNFKGQLRDALLLIRILTSSGSKLRFRKFLLFLFATFPFLSSAGPARFFPLSPASLRRKEADQRRRACRGGLNNSVSLR